MAPEAAEKQHLESLPPSRWSEEQATWGVHCVCLLKDIGVASLKTVLAVTGARSWSVIICWAIHAKHWKLFSYEGSPKPSSLENSTYNRSRAGELPGWCNTTHPRGVAKAGAGWGVTRRDATKECRVRHRYRHLRGSHLNRGPFEAFGSEES